MLKKLASLSILALLVFGYFKVKPGLDRYVDRRALESDFRIFPSNNAAVLMASGYEQLLADFYWIEAVNYFGGQLAQNSDDYSYLPEFVRVIVALDPLFGYFYDWAATAYIYNSSPLTRDDVVKSQRIANKGIMQLYEFGVINGPLTLKAAFNYALESDLPAPSYDYFRLLGRSSRHARDYLMIGASYAMRAEDTEIAKQFFDEFFSYKIFEVQTRKDFNEVLSIVSSQAFNAGAAEFLKNLRLMNEANDEVKELIETRYEDNPALNREAPVESEQFRNSGLQRLLNTDISKNWLPPELHLLISI